MDAWLAIVLLCMWTSGFCIGVGLSGLLRREPNIEPTIKPRRPNPTVSE